MGTLTLIVEFAIKPGRLDDFLAAAEALRTQTAGEPGSLRYDWHVSDDGLRDVNIEIFSDSEAFVTHFDASATILGPLLEVSELVRIDAIGDVSPAARERLESVGATFLRFVGGLGP